MSTLESFFAMLGGKAWRSATEMVASPDLLTAAIEHMQNPSRQQFDVQVAAMPSQGRGGFGASR